MTYEQPLLKPTKIRSPDESVKYVHRLGLHHFAHLRAVAEGIEIQDCAKRYLGVDHGHQARSAHQQTVEQIRGLARRKGETAWRLIGLSIKVQPVENQPSLDDFIDQRDLDGWSQLEISEMYAEAYPVNSRDLRRARLRERQLDLINRLSQSAAERPTPTDLITGWFDDITGKKLLSAGFTTLADLNRTIAVGGNWYKGLPAVGRTKATRIEEHLATLLPKEKRPTLLTFSLNAATTEVVFEKNHPVELHTAALLDARSDQEAIKAWVNARAGSIETAKTYHREAKRFLLWLQYDRADKGLAQVNVTDCGDYMAFLQHIPDHWISRKKAAPENEGWAPFRGQLNHGSHRQAIVIIVALFTWLLAAEYINRNPWKLINLKTGDDKEKIMLDTKALSEGAMIEILNIIEKESPSPSTHRIIFILRFLESVGLRSSELLNAKLRDLRLEPEGWVMAVHGKGAKNRIVAVPGQAHASLQNYLKSRNLGNLETAPPDLPLLSSTRDFTAPIGYQALYEHVHLWLEKAIRKSALSAHERQILQGASTHWLRHTFGTRAIAREVPIDVIQAQMGHASIQTTTATYGRAPIRRRVDELGKAFR